jgi:tetratricopeptide (TPR) repeat protein
MGMSRRYGIALLSVWPGLAQIWTGQEVLGLLLAAFFAATLNLAILTQTVWTEMLTPALASFLSALAVLTWILALAYTVWWLWRCHPDRYHEQIEGLYREALECYLQGRWNDARRRLEQILARDDGDADALMQLGSLFVRTDQPSLARRAFRQCLEQEGGAKWRWEIERALSRLDET